MFGTTAIAQEEGCPEPSSPERTRALAAQAFNEGEALFESHDCGAIEKFQCSFNLFPHPSTLFNIGRSAEQCDRPELAVDVYQRFIAVYPDNSGRSEVETRLRSVEQRVAVLEQRVDRLETPPEPPPPEPEPEPEPTPEPVPPEPVPQPRAGMAIAGWASLGVGGALFLTSIGLLAGAASHANKLEDILAQDELPSEEELQAYANQGRSLQVSGWVLFGVGSAVLITGVVLTVLARLRRNSAFSDRSTVGSVEPWIRSMALELQMQRF